MVDKFIIIVIIIIIILFIIIIIFIIIVIIIVIIIIFIKSQERSDPAQKEERIRYRKPLVFICHQSLGEDSKTM